MTAELVYFGLTYPTAPLALRERLRPDRPFRQELYARLAETSSELFILSTCERFEVYGVGCKQGVETWQAMISNAFGVSTEVLQQYGRIHVGGPVISHLLRVASGLESRILGEPQILAQIRNAHEEALEARTLGPFLSTVCRTAIHTGRRVRRESMLNGRSRSIVSIAADHLSGVLRPLDKSTVIVVGTGDLGQGITRMLASRRVGKLVLAGRDLERTRTLASTWGAEGIGMTDVAGRLVGADALITCTSAPTFIVNQTMVEPQRTRALFILDLGVPRNVDPLLRLNSQVCFTHLEELLSGSGTQNTSVVRAAVSIVAEEYNRVAAWVRHRSVAKGIQALVESFRGPLGDRNDPHLLHSRIMHLKAGVAA